MNTETATTKERIIEAGSQAIAAKSFNGCGLKEILDAAAVPKGSFYHYFKSKEDFGVAVIEHSAEEHATFIRGVLNDRSISPLNRIHRLFKEMRDYYAEAGPSRECIIAKLALEVAQLSEPMRLAIKYAYDNWSALLARTLREAQAAGEICKELNAESLAELLVNAWEGVTIRMQIDKSVEPIDEFLNGFVTTILPCRS